MQKIKRSQQILILASIFPFIGAILHLMVIFGGYSWYEFFYAPPVLLESAKAGTFLAPLSTLFVATLMAIAGLYALSGAGIILRFPFLKLALIILSFLFISRGMLIFHLMFWKPEVIDSFRVISSSMFLLSGLAYAIGTYMSWHRN